MLIYQPLLLRIVGRLSFVFILLSFCMWSFGQSDTKDQIFSIVFYNVENLFDAQDDPSKLDEEFLPFGERAWTYTKYKKKLDNLFKTLAAIGGWSIPDIIGLSEVENRDVLDDLVDNSPLVKDNYKIIHFDSDDRRGIDVALLYRESSFRPLGSSVLQPFISSDPDYRTRDILYVKGLLEEDTLNLFVNHWPSRRDGILKTSPYREAAARTLSHVVDSLLNQNPQSKVIIMGDFNDTEENPSLSNVLGTRQIEEKVQKNQLYFLPPVNPKFPGTYKFQGQWHLFDRFIVSGILLDERSSLRLSIDGMHIFSPDFLVLEDDRYLGKKPFPTFYGFQYMGGFSDHFPIWISLQTSK